MTLTATFKQLQAGLEPLGVEIGLEVLALWIDRRRSGRDPLPVSALRGLADWTAERLAEQSWNSARRTDDQPDEAGQRV